MNDRWHDEIETVLHASSPEDVVKGCQLIMSCLIEEQDMNAIQMLVDRYPRILSLLSLRSECWLQVAAETNNNVLIDFFFNTCVDFNQLDISGGCALSAFARAKNVARCRQLIELGADPGISFWPLVEAIVAGSLELVKLFVDHGADINTLFGEPARTPLSTAITWDRTEIVDYLRGLGAEMPPEVMEAESFDMEKYDGGKQIWEYFLIRTGMRPNDICLNEILPSEPQVAVWTIQADRTVLFTAGMSNHTLRAPPGLEYAELTMSLPNNWPSMPPLDSPESWPWRWLRVLARFPHETGRFYEQICTFGNEDPPEPLDTGLDFAGFLLLTNFGRMNGLMLDDGRQVNIITVVPLYTEELELARTQGVGELCHRLQAAGVGSEVHIGRPNVGL